MYGAEETLLERYDVARGFLRTRPRVGGTGSRHEQDYLNESCGTCRKTIICYQSNWL